MEEVDYQAFGMARVKKFMGKNTLDGGTGILIGGVLYVLNYDENEEELIIPGNVTKLGVGLMNGCFANFCLRPNLRTLILSEGVKEIENNAFQECSELESVSLPKSLNKVGTYVFRFCPNLKEFRGDSKFISRDGKCFFDLITVDGVDCFCLQFAVKKGLPDDYEIPESIVSIRPCAFENTTNLRSVKLPDSLLLIESGAFKDCPNFEFIYGKYASEDNKCALVNNSIYCDGNALLAFAGKNVKKYATSGARHIGSEVFAYQTSLEEIVINDEVISLGNYCFAYSRDLKSITLPANLKTIRYDPFIGSKNLEKIYFRSPIPPTFEEGGIEDASYPKLTIYVPQQSLGKYLNSEALQPLRKYIKGYKYDDLPYMSLDYSQDGKVTTMQSASKGKGINVVLMGDAYSDRQIADGTYGADMKYIYDNLFTEEPYKSFRDYFNVYGVNVVSAAEGYEHDGAALGGYFGAGTLVGGNDKKCFEYAVKAVGEQDMNETLIVVAMNSDEYAGTCYMYYPSSTNGTYGSGTSVAYFPKGGDKATFARLLHHEACGQPPVL